jgi:hypothetical protein
MNNNISLEVLRKLTTLEAKFLAVFKKGMDVPNEGWLHEMDHALPISGRNMAAVIGSMVKKKIIRSTDMSDDMEMDNCFWIEVLEGGNA